MPSGCKWNGIFDNEKIHPSRFGSKKLHVRTSYTNASPIYCHFHDNTYRMSADGVIKVADFGLSEDVYMKNYFRMTKDSSAGKEVKLPIKWMALESIHDGLFSEKTDVVCMTSVYTTELL